jgi:iron-sulfur cluster assembly accessory protein
MSEQAEFDFELAPAAEKFIRRMMRLAPNPETAFRMKVTPGGCSGYAVEFDMTDQPVANEVVLEHAGMRLSFDRKTLLLLNGGVVDFIETLSHTGFVVTVPGGSTESCSSVSKLVPVQMLSGKPTSK